MYTAVPAETLIRFGISPEAVSRFTGLNYENIAEICRKIREDENRMYEISVRETLINSKSK